MTPLFEPIEPTLHGQPSTTSTVRLGSMPSRDPSPATFPAPCATCSFALPFRLLLLDRTWLTTRLAGQPIRIRLIHRRQKSFDQRTFIDQIDGMELSDDRRGIVSYTEVEVQFPCSLVLSTHIQQMLGLIPLKEPSIVTAGWFDYLDDVIETISIFMVNRLLAAYRLLADKHYVRPITRGELFYVQRGWLTPGVNSPFSMAFGAPQHAIQLIAHTLSQEFHNTLSAWLSEERDVPVWVELMQDAREYLDVGQYRHVVIDSRTALEVYLDQTLLACFTQSGTTVTQAADCLRIHAQRAQSLTSLEDAIGQANISDKLRAACVRVSMLNWEGRKSGRTG